MRRGECNIKHNGSGTRLYRIWKLMRTRCENKNNSHYKFYGERGIFVCPEWNDFAVFKDWAVSHGYSDELTIERVDNNKGYQPDNCRWATRLEQSKNTRNCKYYKHDGLTMCHNDWARHIGIKPSTLTARIRRHGVSTALSMPKR